VNSGVGTLNATDRVREPFCTFDLAGDRFAI